MKLKAKLVNQILFTIVILIFSSITSFSQNSPLEKQISISVEKESIQNILFSISSKIDFNFSFNSDLVPIDSIVSFSCENKSVKKILEELLSKNYYYKTSGNHIIILRKKGKKEKKQIREEKQITSYTISGYIIDSRTGKNIVNATIYDMDQKESVLTDSTGFYTLTIARETEFVALGFNKNEYLDTVIIVNPIEIPNVNISLKPKIEKIEKISIKNVDTIPQVEIKDFGLVKTFVRREMIMNASNVKIYENRAAQFSFLPYIGTNRKLSGSFKNNFSFNTIAGYSGGVDGVEIGTVLNVSEADVNGCQISGFGNITGGNTNGVQIAGFLNRNLGNVNGCHISGFGNITRGNTNGFQVAGFFNRNGGNVDGLQISGFSNLTYDTLKGVQISCVNHSKINNGFQLGIINMADSSSGISIGFMSIVKNGYYDFSLFTDEMLMPNFVFKMGTHKFYNIWGVSASSEMWGLTYGVGLHRNPNKKVSMNFDFSLTNYSYQKIFEIEVCMKTKISTDVNIKLYKNLEIFAGLSYNIFASDTLIHTNQQKYIDEIVRTGIIVGEFKSVTMQLWPGANLGLKYRL